MRGTDRNEGLGVQLADQVQDQSRMARGASDGGWVLDGQKRVWQGLAESGLIPSSPYCLMFEDDCGLGGNESGTRRV